MKFSYVLVTAKHRSILVKQSICGRDYNIYSVSHLQYEKKKKLPLEWLGQKADPFTLMSFFSFELIHYLKHKFRH